MAIVFCTLKNYKLRVFSCLKIQFIHSLYTMYTKSLIPFKLFKNVLMVRLKKSTTYIMYVSRATGIRNKDLNTHIFTRAEKTRGEQTRYICMNTQVAIVLS